MSLQAMNSKFRHASPDAVARWALRNSLKPMVTTSFGLHAAAMLHLVTRIRPDIPVVWVDTGFNTPDTYRHADLLTRVLRLNLKVYAPDLTRARIEAAMGGVPPPDGDERHAAFASDVKLRPFERALAELEPDLWLTGIRADETDWRRNQAMIARRPGGILKVAPFFWYTEAGVETYLRRFSLPFGDPLHYDPAKAAPHRECGLHLAQ